MHTPFVLVLDSDAHAIEELAPLIRSAGWHPMVASSPADILAQRRRSAAGCALVALDLAPPGEPELRKLMENRAGLPVIFMSNEVDVEATVRVMKAGALDVLSKPLSTSRALSAMTCAIEASQAELDRAFKTRELLTRYASLTRRERQVLQLVVAGHRNKQVGAELGISVITVKAHRGQVMRKMQAGSFAQLVHLAASLQLGNANLPASVPRRSRRTRASTSSHPPHIPMAAASSLL